MRYTAEVVGTGEGNLPGSLGVPQVFLSEGCPCDIYFSKDGLELWV